MGSKNCPRCGSENVKPDVSGTTVFSHGNINKWICNECGYSGVMPEENMENNEEEREGLLESYLNNIQTREILFLAVSLLILYVLYLILI